MWFVGQFARVAKSMSDESRLDELTTSIGEIRKALSSAHPPAAAPNTPPSSTSPAQPPVVVGDATASTLAQEAQAAVKGGLWFSGLLTAAVAFEHSVRAFAKREGIEASTSAPIPHILRQLRSRLGDGIVDELSALWRVRHTLVHYAHREGEPLHQAEGILSNFLWAITFLNEWRRLDH
jgi:hypothetical protein